MTKQFEKDPPPYGQRIQFELTQEIADEKMRLFVGLGERVEGSLTDALTMGLTSRGVDPSHGNFIVDRSEDMLRDTTIIRVRWRVEPWEEHYDTVDSALYAEECIPITDEAMLQRYLANPESPEFD